MKHFEKPLAEQNSSSGLPMLQETNQKVHAPAEKQGINYHLQGQNNKQGDYLAP